MPKLKKFDKKNAVTFQVVHRSQHDPLIANESAPQHVLIPVKSKADIEKRREEQRKFGIYYDDDYDYLQHLRNVNTNVTWEKVEYAEKPQVQQQSEEPTKLNLPSSVFASNVEEKVGMLNKAAPHTGPRLDLDPDIVAAMDDDFDYEDPNNELEDNFMDLANASCSEDEENDEEMGSDFDFSDEERDEVGSLEGPQYTFADEETKSRFTEYSMSSSVIRRNKQLSLLDERFEKMFESYDENEVGALDCDEIEGFIDANSSILLQCAEEFEQARKLHQMDKDKEVDLTILNEEFENSSNDDEDMVKTEVKDKEKWDCESILSTYSNIYNRPKLISEPKNNLKIKINLKTGLPVNILGQNKLTAKNLSQFDALNNQNLNNNPLKSVGAKSVISALSTLSIRPKNESPEERKVRKNHLKEYRKARRVEKKINSEAFKEEAKRQFKIALNNKNNLQGNKIL